MASFPTHSVAMSGLGEKQTFRPLTLWNAFVNGQLDIPGDRQWSAGESYNDSKTDNNRFLTPSQPLLMSKILSGRNVFCPNAMHDTDIYHYN